MLIKLRQKNGQDVLGHGVLCVGVIAGLLATQIFVKRGIENKYRFLIDRIEEQYSADQIISRYDTIFDTQTATDGFAIKITAQRDSGKNAYLFRVARSGHAALGKYTEESREGFQKAQELFRSRGDWQNLQK